MLHSQVSPGLTSKQLERLARDKHFSLLRKYINYSRKLFYCTGPWSCLAVRDDVVSLGRYEKSGLYYKSFTIAISNHNDSDQYNKTTITIVNYAPNLALALASGVHNLE